MLFASTMTINIFGFVIDESPGKWIIHLEDVDEPITMQRPAISHNKPHHYIYNDAMSEDGKYQINYYWPIRLLLNRNGLCKMAFNRVTFDSSYNIIWNIT